MMIFETMMGDNNNPRGSNKDVAIERTVLLVIVDFKRLGLNAKRKTT